MTARVLVPCGSRSAAERHRSRCEDLCQPCIDASRIYDRDRKRRVRATTDIEEMSQHV